VTKGRSMASRKLEDGRVPGGVERAATFRQGDGPTPGPGPTFARRSSAVYGTDFGVHNVTWLSRFTDMAPGRRAGLLTERDGCCWPATRAHVAFPRRRTRDSTYGVQDGREPGMESWPRWCAATIAGRSLPRYLSGPKRHRSVRAVAQDHDGAQKRRLETARRTDERLARRPCPSCSGWTGPRTSDTARDDVGSGHSLRTSARDTRWSGAACPDLDLVTESGPTAGVSPCCTIGP